MSNVHDDEFDVKEALQMSVVELEPSQDLMHKLRVLAGKATPARRAFWQPTLAVLGACAAAAIVVGLSLTPSKATAKTFDSLVQAAEHVNAFEFSIDSDKNDKHELITIAGADGRFTIKTGEGALMRFDGGALNIYDSKDNTITRIKLGGMVDPKMIAGQIQQGISQGLKEMDLKKMLRDYERKYGKDHIQISPVTNEDGKDVYHVTMDAPDEPTVVKMTVDAATDLPDRIQIDKSGSDNDGSAETADIQMRFGSRVDESALNVQFPADAKVNDIDINGLVNGIMGGGKNGINIGPMMEQLGEQMKKGFGELHKDSGDDRGSIFEQNGDTTIKD